MRKSATTKTKLEQTVSEKQTIPVDLDRILSPQETADWMGCELRALLANVRKRRIPVMRINQRVFRFHPRSILAALQGDPSKKWSRN
jgi:hypothetical protein